MAMTPKEIIAVVQHFDAGGEVQYKARDSKWISADCPTWNFAVHDYRPKPKPLELWVNVYPNGATYLHRNKAAAINDIDEDEDCRTVHMREVVDD